MPRFWRERARAIKRDTLTLYFAWRDPRTPLAARVLAAGVAAYALSPIDLIPDFIPVLGLLDDFIIVPLGIAAVVRLIPEPVLVDARARAAVVTERPTNRAAAVVIVAIWLGLLTLVVVTIANAFD